MVASGVPESLIPFLARQGFRARKAHCGLRIHLKPNGSADSYIVPEVALGEDPCLEFQFHKDEAWIVAGISGRVLDPDCITSDGRLLFGVCKMAVAVHAYFNGNFPFITVYKLEATRVHAEVRVRRELIESAQHDRPNSRPIYWRYCDAIDAAVDKALALRQATN